MSKIAEIRMLFEAKIKDGIPDPPGCFDTRDLNRIKSDKYLYRVLEHCQNNVQQAVEMLYDIMVWRKTTSANDISEGTVNLEYLKEGIFFPHGRDIDSCILFVMKSKIYIKGQKNIEELKKVIVYWLERIEREEGGKKLTLFFDMDGCGLNNMDIDIIMYMVTLLKNYYPNLVNYIIVFQLPWMLSAGFKIVKSILPAAAVERLRMVNKDKLKEIVAPEQALVSWGGKDNYIFEFIPENRDNVDKTTKHVSFSEDCSSREMLSLNPNKILVFKTDNNKITAQLTITNIDESCISFKIRTTAPEKYCVRPSTGILLSKTSQTVQIINTGYQITSMETDRFLVVSMAVPNSYIPQKELSELWKQPGIKTEEYRLRCSTIDTGKSISTIDKENLDSDSIAHKLDSLQNSHKKLLKSLHMLKIYMFMTLLLSFLTLFLAYYGYKNNTEYCNYEQIVNSYPSKSV